MSMQERMEKVRLGKPFNAMAPATTAMKAKPGPKPKTAAPAKIEPMSAKPNKKAAPAKAGGKAPKSKPGPKKAAGKAPMEKTGGKK